MTHSNNDLLLQKCLHKVEMQLNWGAVNQWTTQDFENLSEQILAVSGTHLSVATLKRLWGVVKYDSQPTVTTLNAISMFTGFENWRSFVQNNETNLLTSTAKIQPLAKPTKSKQKWWIYGSPFLLLLLMLIVINFISNKPVPSEVDVSQFSFTSEKMVSKGVPNSVVFSYDASKAHEKAPLFIQQSWDERLRSRVSKDEKVHTSIYYHPGFFRAKLVVNEQIVKEHELFIQTDGWLAMVEREDTPVYFEPSEITLENGMMSLNANQLTDKNISLQPEAPWISFYNVGQFEKLYNDDFVMQTKIKNDYSEGANICQMTEIYLILEGGSLSIPLSVKGCVSQLEFYDAKGKKENPSKLGVDFSDWVDIKLSFKGSKGELFINQSLAYNIEYPFGKKRIVGIRYRFKGTGSINALKLTTYDGEIVFEDNF